MFAERRGGWARFESALNLPQSWSTSGEAGLVGLESSESSPQSESGPVVSSGLGAFAGRGI